MPEKTLDSKIRVFSNPPFYAPTLCHPLTEKERARNIRTFRVFEDIWKMEIPCYRQRRKGVANL